MATLQRRSEAEIAEIRAARAAKKAAAADEDGDAAVGAGASTLAYTFHAHSIAIEEDWSGDGSALAGLQWVGGATLARFFDDRSRFPEGYFAGKTVCELGAGVGLTSILLALLGAEVALTDLDCDKAVANVDANLQSQAARDRLQLIELDWYKPNMAALASPYDVLVAGDCCYEAAVIDPLLRVMWNLSSEHTEIYLCGIVGESALHAFNAAVGRYFTVERVESDEAHVELGRRADDDDQKSRLRALMRLRRLNAIADEKVDGVETPDSSAATATATATTKSDGIIMGPTLIRGELEVHVCRCPRLLYRELCHMFPALAVPAERVLAIPTNQVRFPTHACGFHGYAPLCSPILIIFLITALGHGARESWRSSGRRERSVSYCGAFLHFLLVR